MVGRMAFLDGHEHAFTLCASLSFGLKRHVHPGFSSFDVGHPCRHAKIGVHGRRPQQADGVGGGHGAWDLLSPSGVHQSHRCSPIAVAVQQGADDATVDHAREGMMMRFWTKDRHQFLAFTVGIDSEAVWIGGATTVANRTGGIGALHTLR